MGTGTAVNHLSSPSQGCSLACTVSSRAILCSVTERALKATPQQLLSVIQQHFYTLNFWDLLEAGSSTRISPGPTLFQILQAHCSDVFYSRAASLTSKLFCPVLCSLNTPDTLVNLVIKGQTRSIPCWAFQGHTGTSPSEQKIPLPSPRLNKEQQCPTKQNQSHFALG